jgi:hypothetical protein
MRPADIRATRIAELIEPLRVTAGSTVRLDRDFDPAYKANFLKKKDGVEITSHRHCAARGPSSPAGRAGHLRGADVHTGAGRRRQGRHHPSCHERRQPPRRARQQLQAALGRGARPRDPVGHRARTAHDDACGRAEGPGRSEPRQVAVATSGRMVATALWMGQETPMQPRYGTLSQFVLAAGSDSRPTDGGRSPLLIAASSS